MVRAGDEIDQHLGRRLRELRENAGLSRKELAEHIHVTYQQVFKYEIGANRISVSTLLRLAAVFGVGVSRFYEGLPSCPSERKTTGSIAALVDTDTICIKALAPSIRSEVAGLFEAIARSFEVKSC